MNDRDILIYSENKYTEQQQLVKKNEAILK